MNTPDYLLHRENYYFPRFIIPTTANVFEFRMAIPKTKYDAFAILELFKKYHG